MNTGRCTIRCTIRQGGIKKDTKRARGDQFLRGPALSFSAGTVVQSKQLQNGSVGINCLSAVIDHIQIPFVHDLIHCGAAFGDICLVEVLIAFAVNIPDLPDIILSLLSE